MKKYKNYLPIVAIILFILAIVWFFKRKDDKKLGKLDDKSKDIVSNNGKDLKAETKPYPNPSTKPQVSERIDQSLIAGDDFISKLSTENLKNLTIMAVNLGGNVKSAGSYLASIIQFCPFEIKDRAIDAYFREVAEFNKVLVQANKAYNDACVDIFAQAVRGLDNSKSCTVYEWMNKIDHEHTHHEMETTETTSTGGGTTGLLSVFAGVSFNRETMKKTTSKFDQNKTSITPIPVCREWNITKSMLGSLNLTMTTALQSAFAAYAMTFSATPDPLISFNIPKEMVDAWRDRMLAAYTSSN